MDPLGKWYHQSVGHGGRGYNLNKIRSSRLWIAKANSVVWSFILKCVTCRYLRGRVEQKTADLPTDRLSTEPLFAYIRLGMFGPFLIKQHRKKMKRYAIIFTCLPSRAVHLEVVYTMEKFIQSIPEEIFSLSWKYMSQKMWQWHQFYWSPIWTIKSIFRNGRWTNNSLFTKIGCWLDYTEK